jgi:ribosome-associated protein
MSDNVFQKDRVNLTRTEQKIYNIMMEEFRLEGHEFIELNHLLKITGLCSSGGMAKAVIAEGLVKVDGNVELRKRCKIRQGRIVEFEDHVIAVK